jgi:hypothetical protein
MAESDTPVVGVAVSLEPLPVDHDLMVEPAESDQIRRVGRAAA